MSYIQGEPSYFTIVTEKHLNAQKNNIFWTSSNTRKGLDFPVNAGAVAEQRC